MQQPLRCLNIVNSIKFLYFSGISQKIRSYAANPKRFYRNVNVVKNGNDSFEITLDQKKLKTPLGNTLELPNETLALAVATEWDSQEGKIQRESMHLTALCNTVIDNPNHTSKSMLVTDLVNYLDTDAILYHSDIDNELFGLQIQQWNPIIHLFNKKFQININPVRGISALVLDGRTKDILQRHLSSYNLSSVLGIKFAAENLKSVILTLCCVDQEISIEKAVLLSRLEEEFQTKNWGRVEWAHDLNLVDLQSRVSAAITFIRLNLESVSVQSK